MPYPFPVIVQFFDKRRAFGKGLIAVVYDGDAAVAKSGNEAVFTA